jgi:hypothetical protein
VSEPVLEELATNRYVTLLRTSDGYEVVPVGRPAQRFPATDEGSDAAWDSFRKLTRSGRASRSLSPLAIVGVIAAVLWFTSTLITSILQSLVVGTGGRAVELPIRVFFALWPLNDAFFALFAGCTGSYAALWLYRKGLPPIRQA